MACSTPDGPAEEEASSHRTEEVGGRSSQRGQVRTVLRVFRAELARTFAAVGFAAPFVVVDWTGVDGCTAEVGRTKPHRRGCRRPVWNYEGPGQPEGRRGAGKDRYKGSLRFQVFSESLGAWARGRPTFCGDATISLAELLGETCNVEAVGPGNPSHAGPVTELNLQKRGESTGTISVQAVLLHHAFAPSMEWLEEPPGADICRVRSASSSLRAFGTFFSRQSSGETVAGEAHSVVDSGHPHGNLIRQRSPLLLTERSPKIGGLSPKLSGLSPKLAVSDPDDAMQAAPFGQELSARMDEGCQAQWRSAGGSVQSSMSAFGSSMSLRKATQSCTSQLGGRRSNIDLSALTLVHPDNFQLPVVRLGTSGGTAPFFQLVLGDAQEFSPDYFIGKDLLRAEGEVTFYEQVLGLVNRAGGSQTSLTCCGLAPLLSYMLEYAGVVECQAEGEGQTMQQLLVMRNMRDGCKCLRMLDVKIGERTADAGWQGKSSVSAFKQGLLDGLTTSQSEGFRVEGFDGAPKAFTSLDPLLDVSGLPMFSDKDMRKKARRFMLQRMPASEIVMYLADVHQEPSEPSEGPPCWAPSELAEIALHEMCVRLAGLSVACRRSPVPQKWVGSSVALGFEVGECARRDVPEAELRRAVRVNIFDWGRSELNTPERHASLDEAAKQDRAAFWRYYVGGVDRLAWEVARCYRHRFGCANGWKAIRIAIYDFDSMSENDFIGQVTVPLELAADGEEVTVALEDLRGRPVRTLFGPQATVTYRLAYRTFPPTSRLQGAWQATVVRAASLPGRDHLQGKWTSDPYAVLTSISQDGRFQFRQHSSVIERELNPEWNETFEVPVASSPAALHLAFMDSAPGLGTAPLGTLLPPDDVADAEVDRAVQAWVARLDEVAGNFEDGDSDVADEGMVSAPYMQKSPHASPISSQQTGFAEGFPELTSKLSRWLTSL